MEEEEPVAYADPYMPCVDGESYQIGGNDQCERECFFILPRDGFPSAYSSDAPWGNRLLKLGFLPHSFLRADNKFCHSLWYSSPKSHKGSSLLGLRPNAALEAAEEGGVATEAEGDGLDVASAFSDEPLRTPDGKSRPSSEQETVVSWARCSPWATVSTTDNTAATKLRKLFAAAGKRPEEEGWLCKRLNGRLICRVPRGCLSIRKVK